MSNDISTKIRNCKDCMNRLGEAPFYFEIDNQPIMVITAAPSLQAIYKPLPSIRFFRHLCIALFGDKYLKEANFSEKYLQEFCEGNIYWTHYRKCFSPEYSNNLETIDNKCAEKFLQSEINILKPRLIIVFGNEIKEKVSKFIDNAKYKCIYVPFPKSGFESEYDGIRNEIQKYLKYVKKTGISNNAEKVDLSNNLKEHEVHLRFERDAFIKMYNGEPIDLSSGNIDAIWHKNLVIPNMKRSIKLVAAYSFCENQIKVFLYDIFSRKDDYTILRRFRNYSSAKAPTKRDVFEEIKEMWINSIQDYVNYLAMQNSDNSNIQKTADRLCKEMRYLRYFRNAIVHNGGLLDNESIDKISKLGIKVEGIYNFAGSIYITKAGEETIEKFVNEVIDILCDINKYYE